MIKIKLFSWWTGSQGITERFIQQFLGERYKNPNIEFVLDDSYDFAIVFGYTKEHLKTDKDHTLYFFQEPYWSSNWDREAYKKSSRVFCTSKKLFGDYSEFIEGPAKQLYGGHGDMHTDKQWNWSVDSLLGINPNKNKPLSIIQRNSTMHYGENVLYTNRVNLAEALNNSDIDIHIYGGYWVNDNKKVKGEIWNKKIGLNDYMFSIAIENTFQPYYVTEKFYDCIFTDTIPVYYGCSNISSFIDPDCYLQLPDISNIEECINFIRKECTAKTYENKRQSVLKLKKDYFTNPEINIWARIQKELK